MKRLRRLPATIDPAEFADLGSKSNEDLVALRSDIGSLMHIHSASANNLRQQAEAITVILKSRERPAFEISDHAVVRYLQKVKGFDVDGLRREIADLAARAKANGPGIECRAKGDAVAYEIDGIGFTVARYNCVVTCYPTISANNAEKH